MDSIEDELNSASKKMELINDNAELKSENTMTLNQKSFITQINIDEVINPVSEDNSSSIVREEKKNKITRPQKLTKIESILKESLELEDRPLESRTRSRARFRLLPINKEPTEIVIPTAQTITEIDASDSSKIISPQKTEIQSQAKRIQSTPIYTSPPNKNLTSRSRTNINPRDSDEINLILNKTASFLLKKDRNPYAKSSREKFESDSKGFPMIPNEIKSFPYRRNFSNRRIFLKYVTNKIEKENEFVTIFKNNLENYKSNYFRSVGTRLLVNSKENFNDISFTNPPQTVDSTKKTSNSRAPMRDKTRVKKNKPNLNTSRSKSQSVPANTKIFHSEDEKKFEYLKRQNINSVKNVVDLNVISQSSKLSGHYLYDAKKKLGDMNLNNLWPESRMYKITIKANPWVNSFKAKTFANEVNTSFRNTYDTNKFENRFSHRMFPNIKHILSS